MSCIERTEQEGLLVPYGVSTFLFINIMEVISMWSNSSRPLRGIYISIPCPRYPLFAKGLFSTLRRKIFFLDISDFFINKKSDKRLFFKERLKLFQYLYLRTTHLISYSVIFCNFKNMWRNHFSIVIIMLMPSIIVT